MLAPEPRDAAGLLARAFHEDPMMSWVVPNDTERPLALRHYFTVGVRHAARHGRVDWAADDAGVAVWLAPGHSRLTVVRMLLDGHAALPLRLGIQGYRRLAQLNDYALMLHGRAAPSPHWHLCLIGVEPDRRRQGVGHALLRPALERADGERLACYLETASEANIPFYERLGFRVEIRGRIPPDGPPLYAMVRPGRIGKTSVPR